MDAPTMITPPTMAQNGQSFTKANVSFWPAAAGLGASLPFVTVSLISPDLSAGFASSAGASLALASASASSRTADRASRPRFGLAAGAASDPGALPAGVAH